MNTRERKSLDGSEGEKEGRDTVWSNMTTLSARRVGTQQTPASSNDVGKVHIIGAQQQATLYLVGQGGTGHLPLPAYFDLNSLPLFPTKYQKPAV
ncbi:hypothetical protein N7540_005590 [Penicillium herquei]|nr:hypothetical protein N7540_005590 [Penicillium herquei]